MYVQMGGSGTLVNLGNDQGFISKEYIFVGTRIFGKPKAKSRELMLKVDNIKFSSVEQRNC